jgi:hypothetical protein
MRQQGGKLGSPLLQSRWCIISPVIFDWGEFEGQMFGGDKYAAQELQIICPLSISLPLKWRIRRLFMRNNTQRNFIANLVIPLAYYGSLVPQMDLPQEATSLRPKIEAECKPRDLNRTTVTERETF